MSDRLVLYGNRPLSSPFVFSVFVALEEKGLPYEFKLLDLAAGEQHKPDYVEASLTNRVPTLVHGDFALSESSAITEYLDEVFPGPKYTALYPADVREKAKVRQVQALVRTDFQALREERSTDTVFYKATTKPLSEKASGAAKRLIRIATALLAAHGNTVAKQFSIADADLALVLQRLVANGDPVPAPLVQYAQAIWARPSVGKWLAQLSK